MSGRIANVLSVAGSDPSGGAGMQADLRTFAALGTYGCAAIAALTAQNTRGIDAVLPVPAEFLRAQLDALFDDVRVDAVKVGMLGTADAIAVVTSVLRARRPPHVVVDPVLRATTGASLLEPRALGALRDELLPLATVVTPNAAEAGALLGTDAPRTVAESRDAAVALVARGARAALVTGGHLDGDDRSVDVLYDGTAVRELAVARVAGVVVHGAGCTLSSAIAALLAQNVPLDAACARAQEFVAGAIARAGALEVGRGARPVYQLP